MSVLRRFVSLRRPGRGAAASSVALVMAGAALAAPGPAAAQSAGAPRVPGVVVDAGHGGRFPGAVNCDVAFAGKPCMSESDVNLDIALRVRGLLRVQGFRTVLTRTTDSTVLDPLRDIPTWNQQGDGSYLFAPDGEATSKDDLQARVNVANCGTPEASCPSGHPEAVDAFVSIHNNACACGASGTTTFSYPGSADGARLASLIQEEVVKRIRRFDRGTKVEGFYVLRWTRMPAALLEGAFIDDDQEAVLLSRAWFRQKIARGVAAGVTRYFCTVRGTAGPDVLEGTPGDDVICGGAGNDAILGSAGNDVYLGGRGTDLLDLRSSASGVSVDLGAGTLTGPGTSAVGTIEDVVGTRFADSIAGDWRANMLKGLGGDDVLEGRGGDDLLVGGGGADLLLGGVGRDTASYAWASRAVTVDLGAGTASGQGEDGLEGVEDVVGSRFADVLTGSSAANTIKGRAGADTIDVRDGISGNDVVKGGKGADVCSADPGDVLMGCA